MATKSKTTSSKKKTKVLGKESFVNVLTGEYIEMDVVETEVKETDSNFYKIWLTGFLASLDVISNKKVKIAFWIVEHINKDNQLTYSYRQIADKTGISYHTIADTVKELKDADFLRQDGKVLIVNPDYLFKGSASRRANILHRYFNAETGDEELDAKKRIDNLNKTISNLITKREMLEQALPESHIHVLEISQNEENETDQEKTG